MVTASVSGSKPSESFSRAFNERWTPGVDRLTDLFEFVRQAGKALDMQLGLEFVPPRQNQPLVRLDFEDLAAVGDAAVRNHDPPRTAWQCKP